MLKAIDTVLWGYRFRSRLEARYAVFFDHLGIQWQYETEGFLLPSGPYLPDFFLPQFGLWFEVKGRDADPEERERCRELSYGEYPVLLAEGGVGERPLTLFAFDLTDSGGGASTWLTFLYQDGIALRDFNPDRRTICNHCWDVLCCNVIADNGSGWNRVLHAIIAARSARFEHGQSPERRSAC